MTSALSEAGGYPPEGQGAYFLCDIFDAMPKNDLASM